MTNVNMFLSSAVPWNKCVITVIFMYMYMYVPVEGIVYLLVPWVGYF